MRGEEKHTIRSGEEKMIMEFKISSNTCTNRDGSASGCVLCIGICVCAENEDPQ